MVAGGVEPDTCAAEPALALAPSGILAGDAGGVVPVVVPDSRIAPALLPELASVVAAWPKLAEPIRAAILALARTADGAK